MQRGGRGRLRLSRHEVHDELTASDSVQHAQTRSAWVETALNEHRVSVSVWVSRGAFGDFSALAAVSAGP
jgi:hypothetical protein